MKKDEVTKNYFSILQLSSSFKVPRSPAKRSLTPYKAPQPSPAKLRLTHTWSDMMALERDSKTEHKMSNQDIKQQEVRPQSTPENSDEISLQI